MSNFETNIILNQLNPDQFDEIIQSEHLSEYNNLFENEQKEGNKIDFITSTIDDFEELENYNEQTCHLFHCIEREYFTTFTADSMWPI